MTVLFADLAGSTSMQERLDAEATANLMERVQTVLTAAVEGEGGRVVKSTGDGLMAVFGIPVLREDDALRAVKAGLFMQESFAGLAEDLGRDLDVALGLRVGVNTGEVVVVPDADDVVGDPVNVAARLEAAAGLGEVFIGPETRRAVRDAVVLDDVEPLQLKGKSEPVPAARAVAVKASATTDTSFLGRDADMAALLDAFDVAVSGNTTRLVTVLGWPGLGKSRLGAELVAALADRARIVEARFAADGSSSFGPIADAVNRAIDTAALELGADAERAVATLDALLEGASPGSTEQVFWAIRRLLEAASTSGPLVVVLDDLHWAEPAMLDLVEHLAEWLQDAPVLLLALARPELRDVRPAFIEPGGPSHDVVVLGGLDADTCRRLVLDVLRADAVPEAVVSRVLDASEGNPLFLRELVRLLVDDGVLRRDDDGWELAVDIETIELPATVHAALAARIEQLAPDERDVLQAASVVGRHFARGAVAALLASGVAARLDDHLATLHRRALVDPEGTWWEDERMYRFHHVLTRDAAYRRVLKEVRADHHVRYADWLVDRESASLSEHDEVLGWHIEQALVYRRELAQPLDPDLVARGVEHLAVAGRRALAADDLANAASLLGRALALSPGEPGLLRDRCEALISSGELRDAEAAIAELTAAARDDHLAAVADVYAAQLASQRGTGSLHDVAARTAEAAAVLAAHGDDPGVAKAEAVQASALAGLGQIGACEAALDRSLAAARNASDRRRANDVLSIAPRAALWGPSPIARASGRCLDVVRVLRITSWAPHVEAHALRCQAVLEALRDRPDAARRMLANARSTFTDLGHRLGLLETAMFAGIVELLADDPAEAEPHLREALVGLDALGVRVSSARATALLARCLLELGRVEEADALADPELAGDDLKASIGLLGVRAEVFARRGDLREAERLALAAVALAEPTDGLVDHADARYVLAQVLAAAGRDDDARAELARARALYEQKGAVVGVRRCGNEASGSGGAAVTAGPIERRVPANAVSELGSAWDRALRDHDVAALADLYAPAFVFDDHTVQAGEDVFFHVGRLADLADAVIESRNDMLATLGERHGLWRATATFRIPGGGVSESVRLQVGRVDPSGRLSRIDAFSDDALVPAIACLVERWADDELVGAEQERASISARCFRLATDGINEQRWDDYAGMFDENCVLVDHRATRTEVRGRRAILEFVRELSSSADRMEGRVTDLLALTPDAVLWRWETVGDRDGGAFVLPALLAFRIGASGRFDRIEFVPPDDVDAAWACFERFDASTDDAPSPRRRIAPNLATEVIERWEDAIRTGDPALLQSLADDAYVWSSEPLHIEPTMVDADAVRVIPVGATTEVDVVATLGRRHAAYRLRAAWQDEMGATVDWSGLYVVRVSDDRKFRRIDCFEIDQLESSLACLIERWAEEETEASERSRGEVVASLFDASRSLTAGDWPRYRALYDDGVVSVDHRPTSAGEVHGPDAIVEWARAWYDHVDEMRTAIVDVLALSPAASVLQWQVRGHLEGATYEATPLVLVRYGESGRIDHQELFDADQVEEALGRYRELTEPPLVELLHERLGELPEAIAARRWDAVRSAYHDDALFLDHRPVSGVGAVVGGDEIVEWMQAYAAEEIHVEVVDLLAIDRAAVLYQTRIRGSAEGGAFESCPLIAVRGDDRGRVLRQDHFGADQIDEAWDCYERFAAQPPDNDVVCLLRRWATALGRGDLETAVAVNAPDVVNHDRRPLVGIEPLVGRDGARAHTKAILEINPQVLATVEPLVTRGPRLSLIRQAFGVERSNEILVVSECDPGGEMLTRNVMFDETQLDEAMAELDRLEAEHRGGFEIGDGDVVPRLPT